ncbi:RNA methylase family protein [Paecilomyces variotii No. 5]|uniref:tRNA (guanine(10)-N(2))-methyltransferase n=1 Tax=Byssochlamys spectabilis (strain No. 5 / NBRC 109023) TaxID=1356009 RepID=V5I5K6_BYSSN|nr:RNA methylase family protein [Paecilomyces variotii No. 5]
MEYLIRFAQAHETFRRPEIQALATLAGVDVEFVSYDPFSPYALVKVQDERAARALIARSILAKDIIEIWGQGTTYDELHADVRRRTSDRWAAYNDVSFRFTVDSFASKRSQREKRDIIQSFAYLGFDGPIRMKDPDEDFWVLEEHTSDVEIARVAGAVSDQAQETTQAMRAGQLEKIYFGRWIASGSRDLVAKYDLKKRRYISTTSMDAELSLVTANMALAAPGKVFFDPFVGTGSFCVAAAHYGALTLGSDIDPRSFRGKEEMSNGKPMALMLNFQQYGLESRFLDAFTSDLTNTPLRDMQFLDGIVCDPPYGVREGLRVLGLRDGRKDEIIVDGVPAHLRPGYIAPKRPYGFEAMLRDILNFASRTLVVGGRLSMWMPTASDEDIELEIPTHPNLEVVSVCVQPFNNWSRRLITYSRLPEGVVAENKFIRQRQDNPNGVSANDLNAFRRKYFMKNSKKDAEIQDHAQEQQVHQ